jgi:phosphatidylglycerol---prolipoprotein diacylglyceryl transferase
MLLHITWDYMPEMFSLGPLTIRWYGVLFALGFVIGQYIIQTIYKWEKKPLEDLDYLLLHMVLATVIGARLGHCLFYQPEYYLQHPLEIFQPWKGGLASHGTTVGILTGIWLYSNYKISLFPFEFKKQARTGQSFLYVLDRIVLTVALGGCFIRFGNLMNSEIVGLPTDLPWGFLFVNGEPSIADVPRHPSQLYESISCLVLFFFLCWLYNRTREKTPEGRIFGTFLVYLFTLRFFYEFLKVEQVDFEKGMFLNMGQLLSIPFVLIGLYVLWLSETKHKPKMTETLGK